MKNDEFEDWGILIPTICGLIISFSSWKFLSYYYPEELLLIMKGCYYYITTSIVVLIYNIGK